jgi:hypothetical protein
MAKNRQYPTSPESPEGCPQVFVTKGNIVTPIEGFSSDAGAGEPPRPGMYGQARMGPEIPKGEKKASGDEKAMSAYFGNGKRGKV